MKNTFRLLAVIALIASLVATTVSADDGCEADAPIDGAIKRPPQAAPLPAIFRKSRRVTSPRLVGRETDSDFGLLADMDTAPGGRVGARDGNSGNRTAGGIWRQIEGCEGRMKG